RCDAGGGVGGRGSRRRLVAADAPAGAGACGGDPARGRGLYAPRVVRIVRAKRKLVEIDPRARIEAPRRRRAARRRGAGRMSGVRNMRQGVDFSKLPAFAPDPALWSRIVAAREAGQRRRRWDAAGMAAVAAAVFAAVLLVPRAPLAPAGFDAVVAGERESRMLEGEWLRVAP